MNERPAYLDAPADIRELVITMCDKYVDEGPSEQEIVMALWNERQYWHSKLHAIEQAVIAAREPK